MGLAHKMREISDAKHTQMASHGLDVDKLYSKILEIIKDAAEEGITGIDITDTVADLSRVAKPDLNGFQFHSILIGITDRLKSEEFMVKAGHISW